jgi:hypothetical protein
MKEGELAADLCTHSSHAGNAQRVR